MKTLSRSRDMQRETHLSVVVALAVDEEIDPGDVVMLEDVGACLVLSRDAPLDDEDLAPEERTLRLEVEAFALGNSAVDIP